jgi:hypothetical protein
MGMGIQPFSDMGYEVSYSEFTSGIGNVSYNYQGEGSTSKAFYGASINIYKGLSLGANLNYIFGRLNQNSAVGFDSSELFYITKTEGTRLRDFTLTYGLQYDLQIKKDQYLTLGVTFEKQSNFNVLHRLFSYKSITLGTSNLTDTLQYRPEIKDKIKLPSTFGIGLSYSKLNKLEVNLDYYHAGWSNSKTSFVYDAANDKYSITSDDLLTNQNRISAGFEYIPQALSIRSYLQKVRYRAGIHHESSYLKLSNQQINEFGISFGAGLPFTKSKSTANIAIELGKKGTTNNNLVRENYMKLSVYLNLYDYWFVKRKFD